MANKKKRERESQKKVRESERESEKSHGGRHGESGEHQKTASGGNQDDGGWMEGLGTRTE